MQDNRPFADPSDESKLILDYDRYVKTTVKAGGTPQTPDAWMEARKPVPIKPIPEPEQQSEADKQRIQDAFSNLMIPQGFGSRAERMRNEIKQWYALKRTIDRVFNKLLDAEVLKQRALNKDCQ